MEIDAPALAIKWRDACNSHDLERILALYSEEVVFKSPRVRTVWGESTGILLGKENLRDYWRKLLERRPDLIFEIGAVFAGVDSIVLEYHVGELHGVEFMALDDNGLIAFAAGNDEL